MKYLITLLILITSISLNAQFQNLEEISPKKEKKESSEEKEEEKEEEKDDKKDDKKSEEKSEEKKSGGMMQQFNSMMNTEKEIPENMKYHAEKYEHIFTDFFFDEVWNATIEAVEATNCFVAQKSSRQDDEGFYKGKVVSDFCVLASTDMGEDVDVYDTLKFYSVQVPVIRGGVWKNGRIQYKIIIKENEDETVRLLIKSELSGLEEYVTNEVHFWESSGWLEHFLLEDIKARLEDL